MRRARRWRTRGLSDKSGLPVLPIGIAMLVAVLASGLANREAARTAEHASRQEAVLGTVEADLAVSHIRVEELVAGDQTVDAKTDIVANQAKAVGLCRALRERGPHREGE